MNERTKSQNGRSGTVGTEPEPRPGRGERPDMAGLLRRVAALEADRAELQRSNADLVEFASVAAHELRSPLQTVTGFAEILADHVGASLDAQSTDYLHGIQRNASRLQALVEALLVYARIGTTVRQRVDVHCDQLVAEACESIACLIVQTGAEVTCGPLPTVIGDPVELALVFQNLISNALKFARAEIPPRVHITARRDDGAWRFEVSDNGLGIEPHHRDRVFRVFQRLPGQVASTGSGTGIGLAICKRVIEGHGGRIWAEGKPERGACIIFTLPIPVCWSPF